MRFGKFRLCKEHMHRHCKMLLAVDKKASWLVGTEGLVNEGI